MGWFFRGWTRVRPNRRTVLAMESLENRELCAADLPGWGAPTTAPYQRTEKRAALDQASLDLLFERSDVERFWDDG